MSGAGGLTGLRRWIGGGERGESGRRRVIDGGIRERSRSGIGWRLRRCRLGGSVVGQEGIRGQTFVRRWWWKESACISDPTR
jgi:hypothetical protein